MATYLCKTLFSELKQKTMHQLLVATTNEGKVKEIQKLLSKTPVELLSLNLFDVGEVNETGATFAENSELKARSYAQKTGHWTLADDSGLEVRALGGAPGVISARYAGVGASDSENVAKLLSELAEVSDTHRLARFVCSISVSDKFGNIHFKSEGICSGTISFSPRGDNGFGYDPIFIPEGFEKTFAELDDSIKQRLSHRAMALKKIIPLFVCIS